jgi:hypothetical protein
MEKTATKAIVEAELQMLHHGGSKSVAWEVITVDDPDALSCPKCLHPLKPPVYQVQAYELQLDLHTLLDASDYLHTSVI